MLWRLDLTAPAGFIARRPMSRRRVGGLTCHVISAPPTLRERQLLAAARAGDSAAFGQLVEANRASLHVHCYRMLGSLHDADDALQETLLRAWRALPSFGGRCLLRAWLYRIATNVCLTLSVRGGGRAALDPYPDQPDDGRATPEARYEQREQRRRPGGAGVWAGAQFGDQSERTSEHLRAPKPRWHAA